jgi:micrococcal nuclease
MRFNPRILGILLIVLGLAGLLLPRLQAQDADSQRERGSRASSGHVSAESAQATVPHAADRKSDRQSCKVLTVYDGDTLGCDLNGNGHIERPEEEIRLLGVDSPEMHYSRKNPTHDTAHPVDEPFAPEASRWMETHTLRKVVYLEFDARRSDRYNRTLAYVYTGPQEVASLNEQLLETGYAKTLFLGKNRMHEEEFLRIEAEARQAGRGLWGMK